MGVSKKKLLLAPKFWEVIIMKALRKSRNCLTFFLVLVLLAIFPQSVFAKEAPPALKSEYRHIDRSVYLLPVPLDGKTKHCVNGFFNEVGVCGKPGSDIMLYCGSVYKNCPHKAKHNRKSTNVVMCQ